MVDVAIPSMYQDFLIAMNWTDSKVLGRQRADVIRGNWLLFKLRTQYGDQPGQIRM
jgi:hypothetical protein